MLVLLFHYTSFLPNGYIGVDIFFVVSGYVLSGQFQSISVSDNRHTGLRQTKYFLKRRFLRLFPAFVIITSVSIIILHFVADSRTVNKAIKQFLWTLVGFGNVSSYSLSGNYFNPEPNSLIHLWSLSAEVQIYFFTLVAAIIARWLNVSFLKLIGFLTALSILMMLFNFDLKFYSFIGIEHANSFSYYSPMGHFYQFTAGIALALTFKHSNIQTFNFFRFPFKYCLAFLLLSCALFNQTTATLICTIITLIFLAFPRDKKVDFLQQCFVWIGNRSYSIYLAHLPILYIYDFALISLGLRSAFLVFLLSTATTLSFASYSFRTIELKFKLEDVPSLILASRMIFCLICILISSLLAHDNFQSEGRTTQVNVNETFNCTSRISFIKKCGNERATFRILVLGDSHASAVADSLLNSDVLHNLSLDVAVETSCPFFLPNKFSSSRCSLRNQFIANLVQRKAYNLVISTFRNPFFMNWTPGKHLLPEYDLDGITGGIKYLNDYSSQHLLLLPNSELSPETNFSKLLSSEKRVKGSQISKLSNQFDDSTNFVAVRTDLILCNKFQCGYHDLIAFLGPDGNHLNQSVSSKIGIFLKTYIENLEYK